MKHSSKTICLLFLLYMISSPFLISIEANVSPTQIAATFPGELLPNPFFTEEPTMEVTNTSSEFYYEYTPGSVTLVWAHTAGYEPAFKYQICNESVSVLQEFHLDFNETFQAVKMGASIKVDCTGDFADPEVLDDMWEVKIRLQHPDDDSHYGMYITTLNQLKNGDSDDIEYIYSRVDTGYFFDNLTSTDPYQLSIQLIPRVYFTNNYGGLIPFQDYEGSVRVTIDHMSFEVMLGDTTTLAPPVWSPIYNTTNAADDSSWIVGIESTKNDTICEFRRTTLAGPVWKYNLLMLSSNHQLLRNISLNQFDETFDLVQNLKFAVSDERIAVANSGYEVWGSGIIIHIFDSEGNYLLNTTLQLFENDFLDFLEFDSSGNLLLLTHSVISTSPPSQYYQRRANSITKLDTQGNTIWTKKIRETPYLNFDPSTGFATIGNNTYVGLRDKIQKYDSNGSLVWSRNCTASDICADPQGGIYSVSRKYSPVSELTRWNPNGEMEWTISLGWNIESRWMEYPWVTCMSVGPDGRLHLVLRYNDLHACVILKSITDTGQLLTEDTLFETNMTKNRDLYLGLYIAITNDDLVHIAGLGHEYPDSLLTYGESVNPPTIPPTILFTIVTVGVASVLMIGFVSYFIIRRKRTLVST